MVVGWWGVGHVEAGGWVVVGWWGLKQLKSVEYF